MSFHKFTAIVNFAPDALADARFDVEIDLNSVDTMDKDRDGTMRGRRHLRCRALSDRPLRDAQLHQNRGGLYRDRRADAARSHQGGSRSIFKFAASPGGAKLIGSAKLKRLDFGVGRGDWKSTEWVADAVNVAFALLFKPSRLKPKPAP